MPLVSSTGSPPPPPYLHLEVEVDDRDVSQHSVGQHVPGIVHRALLGSAKELLDPHLAGDVLERLLLGVHVGSVALLWLGQTDRCFVYDHLHRH